MTLKTLRLLRRILHASQLSVGADDFVDTATEVLEARKELDITIEELERDSSK